MFFIFNVYQKKMFLLKKKNMNDYLAQRIYQHEEFEDYIKRMRDEFVNERINYSTEICFTIIIIFIKKPVDVYSITLKWLNNIYKFCEKYDG